MIGLETVLETIKRFRAGKIDVLSFCDEYGKQFNLDLDKSELDPMHRSVLMNLFEKVVWFSPFPEERLQIPNYLGEDAIVAEVERAAEQLGLK
jgi:hypothetical protein